MTLTANKVLGLFAAAMISFAPMTASAGDAHSSGSFIGKSDHITTGGVKVIKTADGGAVVILDSDFSLDGAPDPRVAFGTDGKYDDASNLGVLQSINGLQMYRVPATVNVDKYNEVYIWCSKFSVPLGVASLK